MRKYCNSAMGTLYVNLMFVRLHVNGNIHFHLPCKQLSRNIVLFGIKPDYFMHVNMVMVRYFLSNILTES